MPAKLSALVVAHNEAEVIEDCLKSLVFCDEIVVVLDKCTDGTKAIAERYAHTLVEGSWELEGERRNTGIDACAGDWILEVDADERIHPDLAIEITQHIQAAPEGYVLLPVDNYVGQRLVLHGWAGSFGTTRAKKLFKKGCKLWGAQRVHPSLELKGQEMRLGEDLAPGHRLIHLVDKDINDMLDRLKRYTDAAAADMRQSKRIPKFRTSIRKGLTRFYKSYWARKGYKEGRYGFLIALMAALFPILTHLKAELE